MEIGAKNRYRLKTGMHVPKQKWKSGNQLSWGIYVSIFEVELSACTGVIRWGW